MKGKHLSAIARKNIFGLWKPFTVWDYWYSSLKLMKKMSPFTSIQFMAELCGLKHHSPKTSSHFLSAGCSKTLQGSGDNTHIFTLSQKEHLFSQSLETSTLLMQIWVIPLTHILCFKLNISARDGFISMGSLINTPAEYGALLTLATGQFAHQAFNLFDYFNLFQP